MPPLRSGRISRACTLCHRQKTRCYPSTKDDGTCLRCETLGQTCSLVNPGSSSRGTQYQSPSCTTSTAREQVTSESVNERFERLEKTVAHLIERLDSGIRNDETSWGRSESASDDTNLANDANPAPVFLIRDAATEVGVNTPSAADVLSPPQSGRQIIDSVDESTAHSLLEIFQVHYGRWILLSPHATPSTLLAQLRKSPLLLCSVYLIAVRHTTQELAGVLAPKLLQEVRALLAGSLLVTPQTEEFFQAVIVISFWSTTVGQVPLSIDGWLITSYALQQASASPVFAEITKHANHQSESATMDRKHIWTHLCLAHLHHCVGTRRPAALSQKHLQHLVRSTNHKRLSNFESRMIAEVKLYWLIYQMTSATPSSLSRSNRELLGWQEKHFVLFEQARSQFLQLGLHFAHLLADCESLKTSEANRRNLEDIVQSSKAIINIFLDTTDDRTRHLTDHVYHVVTFAALTLCRVLEKHRDKLFQTGHDLDALHKLIETIISGLGSVGLPCHAAYMLAGVVAAKFATLQTRSGDMSELYPNNPIAEASVSIPELYAGLDDYTFMYPDFSRADPFGVSVNMPQWASWS